MPGTWPPKGIETFDPWHLPLLNTLLLLTSGTTVTWAHHALLEGDRKGLKYGLILTVVLGACFTCVQAYEYAHAAFPFSGNMYGATFFMATGFHGFHVLVGTVFLLVCLFRAYAGHFTPTQHLGFEFAAWYWHFVDVVWLFLFICIYVWFRGAEAVGARRALIADSLCYKGRPCGRPFFFPSPLWGRWRAKRADEGSVSAEKPLTRPRSRCTLSHKGRGEEDDERTAHLTESALRGIACRCPRCGKGKLYAGFIDLRPNCEACGLDYAFIDAGDGPAIFIIMIAGAIVVGAA